MGQIFAGAINHPHGIGADELCGMAGNIFRKIRRYIKTKQFDVFIFIKNAQFGKNPEKIMRVFNSGPGGYGPGNLIVFAIFLKKVVKFQNVNRMLQDCSRYAVGCRRLQD